MKSLTEEITDVLRWEVLSGVAAPGVPLKQDEIARRFEVSQVTARDALHRLSDDGILIRQRNRGVRVAPLDAGEAEEIAGLRLDLEPRLIAAATEATGMLDMEGLEAQLQQMASAEPLAGFMRAHERFHDLLYAPAARPITLQFVRDLRARYARYLAHMWRTTGKPVSSSGEHRALLEVVRSGRAKEAADLLRRHIQASTTDVIASIPDLRAEG